ncbi:hypothetical protein STANM309S_01994 [Streptomyces tanashiensis]
MTEIGIRACRERCRRRSAISTGPVAQFRPIMSMPSGSRAVSAAPISEPSSIVPVVSTVTCTITGRSTPTQSRARRAPMTAAFVWSRSCEVSMSRASAPPRIRPSAFCWKASRRGSYVTCPRVGSFVPGPMEPRTQRAPVGGRVGVGGGAGDPGAGLGQLVHLALDAVLGERGQVRPEGVGLDVVHADREVGVVGRQATMSGRVRLRISLQPSRFRKSSIDGSAAWSMVPIAPSATTTRVANSSRRERLM